MKICSNLHWRMKMWRTQISGLLKNDDYQLLHLLNMKIAFLKLLKTEDLKTPLKDVKKMKTVSCAGSPVKKTITAEPLSIRIEVTGERTRVKLLGVQYDQHLWFTEHVTAIISNSWPSFHAIVALRKAGVNSNSLGLFYLSRVCSILSYAALSWYPMLSQKDRGLLEMYQRLCLRIILPEA
mgnify:CR=1 FL=1